MIEYVELRHYTNAAATDYVLLTEFGDLSFDKKYNELGAINFTYPHTEAKALGIKDQSLVGMVVGYSDGTTKEVERYYVYSTSNEKVIDGVRMSSFGGRSHLSILEDAVVYPSNWPITAPGGHEFIDATAGTIWRTLIARAKARGTLTQVNETTFSGTQDSLAGQWVHVLTQQFPTGAVYMQTLADFMDRGIVDARMDGWDLIIANAGTFGQHIDIGTIEVRPANNVTEMTITTDSSESCSSVLIEGEEGTAVERTDSSAQTALGRRRERFIQQGGVGDVGILSLLGDLELTQYARIPAEETVGVTDFDNLEAFKDFDVADWVWVRYEGDQDPVERRIRQVALSVDRDRNLIVGMTLNSILYEEDIKIRRKIESYTGGGGGAYGSTPNIDDDFTVPKPPGGLAVNSGYYISARGEYVGAFTAQWTAPTENVNGSPLSDLEFFEVQYQYVDEPMTDWSFTLRTGSTETSLGYSPVTPGRQISVRVRAVDSSAHHSTWTTLASPHVLTQDTVAPPIPSQPVATSQSQRIDVVWDGLANDGNPMGYDFARTELWQSLSGPTFTPGSGDSEMVHVYAPGGGHANVPGFADGQEVFFRLISIDHAGNRSVPSLAASATRLGPDTQDPVAPSEAPSLSTESGVGYVVVKWDPMLIGDQFAVEVHMSSTANFVPRRVWRGQGGTATPPALPAGTGWVWADVNNPTTEVGDVDGTMLYVREGPQGQPMVPPIVDSEGKLIGYGDPSDFYFRVIPYNEFSDRDTDADGTLDTDVAPASDAVMGKVRQITGPDMSVNSLWAGRVNTDDLETGNLHAEVIIAAGGEGRIEARGAAGQKVGMDADGFYVRGTPIDPNDPDSGPIYVDFPTDDSLNAEGDRAKPNIISGILQAQTLTLTKGGTLNGDTKVNPGAKITLSDRITEPKAAPAYVLTVPTAITADGTTVRSGKAFAAANIRSLAWHPNGYWLAVYNADEAPTSPSATNYRIWRINTDGSTAVWSDDALNVVGVTVLGNYVYALRYYQESGVKRWQIQRFDLEGNFMSEPGVSAQEPLADAGAPTIGNDGTNLLVAQVESTDATNNYIYVRKHGPSGGTLAGGDHILTLPLSTKGDLTHISYGIKDFIDPSTGAALTEGRWVVGLLGPLGTKYYTFKNNTLNNTHIRTPEHDWLSNITDLKGLAWRPRMRINLLGNSAMNGVNKLSMTADDYFPTSVVASSRKNWIKNPSFETNLTHWSRESSTTQWARVAGGAGGSSYALRVEKINSTGTANVQYWNTTIPAAAGEVVQLSFDVKRGSGTGTRYVKPQITWLNASGSTISVSTLTVAMTTAWTRQNYSATAPTGTTSFYIWFDFYTMPIGEYAYLDRVLVEKAATYNEYFDGSTTDSGGTNYTWVSVAHASESEAILSGTTNLITSTDYPAPESNDVSVLKALKLYTTGDMKWSTENYLPVSASTWYVLGGYFRPETVARMMTYEVEWYTSSYASISKVTVATGTPALDTWTWLGGVQQAPSTAAFAVLRWTLPNVPPDEIHYASGLRFAEATVGWTTGKESAVDSLIYATIIPKMWGASNYSIELRNVSTAAQNLYVARTSSPVTAGVTYTWQVKTYAATVARGVRMAITWLNASGAALSTVFSASVTNTVGAWTQHSYAAAAPAGAVQAQVRVIVDNMAVNEVHYVDEAMFERSATLKTWVEHGTETGAVAADDPDGATWYAMTPNNTIVRYSDIQRLNTEVENWYVGYAWADRDPAISTSHSNTVDANGNIIGCTHGGVHTTAVGPRVKVPMQRRAQLTLTSNDVPEGSKGVDEPNAVDFYIVKGTDTIANAYLLSKPPARSGVVAPTTTWTAKTQADVPTSGAAAPLTTNFPTGIPSTIESSAIDADDGLPKFRLSGDGAAHFQSLDVSGVGAAALTGKAFEQLYYSIRAQAQVTGGGVKTVSAASEVKWSLRFLAMSVGRSSRTAPAGYFNIDMPPDGTVIPGYGGATQRTVGTPAAGYISMNAWDALWYVLPYGSGSATITGNFRVTNYTTDFVVPNDWVLLAQRNGDSGDIEWSSGEFVSPGQDSDSPVFKQAIFTSTTEATTGAGNKPAVRIGNIASTHMRIDGDEITAMASDTTSGTLNLNNWGNTVTAGTSGGSFRIGTASTGRYMTGFNFGSGVYATGPAGNATITHGMNHTGTFFVFCQVRNMGSNRIVTVIEKNVNNFVVRVENDASALVVNGSVSIDWIVIAVI